ncbi:hypothetical protein [Paracoccus saliphilus]|uniref:Uncharacterized protein n=1 Tax=Paracoccus saliphilus TaxID=405559 RepID=A0AA46A6G5_9RHOB|nr:hypothetical protein [Paracoccus saliphilus]SIS98221.1 hypothetical protein SAMN05421772_11111 [Paracoccus saliphilus]
MTLELIALRAAQATLFVTFLLTAPTFMALLIRWGGTTVQQAMGW